MHWGCSAGHCLGIYSIVCVAMPFLAATTPTIKCAITVYLAFYSTFMLRAVEVHRFFFFKETKNNEQDRKMQQNRNQENDVKSCILFQLLSHHCIISLSLRATLTVHSVSKRPITAATTTAIICMPPRMLLASVLSPFNSNRISNILILVSIRLLLVFFSSP